MIARTIATGVACLFACWFAMRHNMHMLQLNGYKGKEQARWLRKNIRQQWTLPWCGLLGLVSLCVDSLAWDAWTWLSLVLTALEYRALNRLSKKKDLAYTPRMKRLFAANLLLSAALAACGFLLGGMRAMRGCLILIVALQPGLCLLSNLACRPIEKGIGRYYIRDAKKRLGASPGLQVIGVTGSYGKTSVKFYLQALLQERFRVLATPGSYNTPMGVVKTIRESLQPTHEIFICEMGARYVGDIKEICDIVHPDHGVITSIGPQHLETFLTMERIQDTKFELADALPEDGMLFLNGDCEFITERAGAYGNKVFYYSEKTGDGYRARDVKVSSQGTDFTVDAPSGETARFQMHLIGAHNVINVVGAIAVANRLGIPLADLRVPIRRIRPVEHRMQLRERGDVTIIDDAYNSNPVGSKAAVETLAMFDGLRILVTPGMVELGEKEEEYNFRFGTYAAGCCDYVLLVGGKRTEAILKGVLSQGFDAARCRTFGKLEEALSYAYAIRDPGHKYVLLENDLPDNY